jgi:hypothetical protein
LSGLILLRKILIQYQIIWTLLILSLLASFYRG